MAAMPRFITTKGVKLRLSGEAEVIGRLCATHCGAAHCILDAVPEPRAIPIPALVPYAGLARVIDRSGAGLAPFGAAEPTF